MDKEQLDYISSHSVYLSNKLGNHTNEHEYFLNISLHKAAEYLFPCEIEYSLICAAANYRLLVNVNKRIKPSDNSPEQSGSLLTAAKLSIRRQCHRANKGLFAGLIIGVIAIVSGCIFFGLKYEHQEETASLLFYATVIVVLLTMIISGVMAAYFLRDFGISSEKEKFDEGLLLFALFGEFIYDGVVIIATGSLEGDWGIPSIIIVFVFFDVVQAATQTYMIMDGLNRHPDKLQHMTRKPGRPVVTFLILGNLVVWLINTFQLKQATMMNLTPRTTAERQGSSILMYLCMPLMILFRFHSSACLVDIWKNAYKESRYKAKKMFGDEDNDDHEQWHHCP